MSSRSVDFFGDLLYPHYSEGVFHHKIWHWKSMGCVIGKMSASRCGWVSGFSYDPSRVGVTPAMHLDRLASNDAHASSRKRSPNNDPPWSFVRHRLRDRPLCCNVGAWIFSGSWCGSVPISLIPAHLVTHLGIFPLLRYRISYHLESHPHATHLLNRTDRIENHHILVCSQYRLF